MNGISTLLLHVTDPAETARFYETIFGCAPVEASPTFVLFVLPSGPALGLWKKDGVEPAPEGVVGGSEIGIRVHSNKDVDDTHLLWTSKGAEIVMPPADLDFGRSFVATDPDGHRLRVYAIADET